MLQDLVEGKGFAMDFDSVDAVERAHREGEMDKYVGKFPILTVPNGGKNGTNKGLKISKEVCEALGINYSEGKIAIAKKGEYILIANPFLGKGEDVDQIVNDYIFTLNAGTFNCSTAWDVLGKAGVGVVYGALTKNGKNDSTATFNTVSGKSVKIPVIVYAKGQNILSQQEGGFKPEHLKGDVELRARENLAKKNTEMKVVK